MGNYKGSLVNKLIILPFAFFIECICSVAISVILVWGYLPPYEGAEKYMNISSHIKLETTMAMQPLTEEQFY
jgi:predicted DNA repair protein MutK